LTQLTLASLDVAFLYKASILESKPHRSVLRCHHRKVLNATSQSSFPFSALSNGSPLFPRVPPLGTVHLRRFSRPWRFASSATVWPYFIPLALLGLTPIQRSRALYVSPKRNEYLASPGVPLQGCTLPQRSVSLTRLSPHGLSPRFDRSLRASWTSRVLPVAALTPLRREMSALWGFSARLPLFFLLASSNSLSLLGYPSRAGWCLHSLCLTLSLERSVILPKPRVVGS